MGYSDQRYQTREPFTAAVAASFGTAGSTTISNSNVVALPAFMRKTRLNKVELLVTTIPAATSTNLTAIVKNGTATAGTVTLTGGTAGQNLVGTFTGANAVFAAGVVPTIDLSGTATASGAANGSYTIVFEVQESYE